MDGIKRSRRLLWPRAGMILATGLSVNLGLLLSEMIGIGSRRETFIGSGFLLIFLTLYLTALIVPVVVLTREFPLQLNLSITRKIFIKTFLEFVIVMALLLSLLLIGLVIAQYLVGPIGLKGIQWGGLAWRIVGLFMGNLTIGLIGSTIYLLGQKIGNKFWLIGLGVLAVFIGLRWLIPIQYWYSILNFLLLGFLVGVGLQPGDWLTFGLNIVFQLFLAGLIVYLARQYQPKKDIRG